MTKKLMINLPDVPSELIQLALNDLRTIERSPDYEVDMDYWMRQKGDVCSVCLAGAVMTNSLGAANEIMEPMEFGSTIEYKLLALDSFRRGYINHGLDYMGVDLPDDTLKRLMIVPYSQNRDKFYETMNDLIDELQERGL